MGGLFRLKRRHLPWIAIAIGLILALIGVLLRTAWAPEPLRTASVEPSEDVRLAVSDPGVLDLLSDDVTVTVDVVDAENLAEDNEDGEGEGGDGDEDAESDDGDEDEDKTIPEDEDVGVVLAIARDIDADGWIGESSALRITGLSTEDVLNTTVTDGELESVAAIGSDLWRVESFDAQRAELEWSQTKGRWSLVAASAPDKKISKITFAWPQDTTAPAAIPLIIVGAILLFIGAAVLLLPRSKRDENTADFDGADDETDADETGEPRDEEENSAAPRHPSRPGPSEPSLPDEEPEFAPRAMTRRQIRELEKTRGRSSRRTRYQAPPPPEPDSDPQQSDPQEHVSRGWHQAPQQPLQQPNQQPRQQQRPQRPLPPAPGAWPGPTSHESGGTSHRADHWRRVWGVNPGAGSSPGGGVSSWLPDAADEEDPDAK